jgi:hypothetical protein
MAQCGCSARLCTAVVVLAVLALLIHYGCGGAPHREGFASQRAHTVYQTARDLFTRTKGAATYTEYKAADRAADPVVYTDVRRLWREGRLTPDAVEGAL